MLKQIVLGILLIVLSLGASAQKWVDTSYSIQIDRDSSFGFAIDFAGTSRELKMDIAYPTNDTPPSCGRPLILVFYGGAFMAGDKSVNEVQRLMEEFAKRGYVAIAPNYRLGMYQTQALRNCNISVLFNIEWNCLNVQDTAEWYRAYYRAVQDGKGALRYMVKHADDFNINVNNVFMTGFSAGGITSLGVAFLDHESEWKSFADSLPDALAPNAIYENGCIKKYGWNTNIANMDLSRPSLGNYNGNLHTDASSYKIKGAGNFFGSMFYNLLDSSSLDSLPALYGFHQPNDLIVPYKLHRRVFDGLSSCAYAACGQGIINRPYMFSTPVLRDWANDLKTAGKPYPDVYFDSTTNNTDCLGQIADPSKGGHQLDNWNRTWNMATFFASKIDTTDCSTASHRNMTTESSLKVFPNPASNRLLIESSSPLQSINVLNHLGQAVLTQENIHTSNPSIDISSLPNGMYFIRCNQDNFYLHQSFIKQSK